MKRAQQKGYKDIADYFRQNEECRNAKTAEGWSQETIGQLDESAKKEAQDIPMSRDERESTYGRYAERVVPERAGGDSVRRPYEHFPGEAKGKGKGRGKSTGSTWNESTNSQQNW